jgi:hypothetical protein
MMGKNTIEVVSGSQTITIDVVQGLDELKLHLQKIQHTTGSHHVLYEADKQYELADKQSLLRINISKQACQFIYNDRDGRPMLDDMKAVVKNTLPSLNGAPIDVSREERLSELYNPEGFSAKQSPKEANWLVLAVEKLARRSMLAEIKSAYEAKTPFKRFFEKTKEKLSEQESIVTNRPNGRIPRN